MSLALLTNASNTTQLVLPESLQSAILTLKNWLGVVSWLVGGVVGITLIFMVLKHHEFRKMNDKLEDIRHNLLQLNKKLGVRGVSEQIRLQEGTVWQRIKGNWQKFTRLFRSKKR